MHLQHWGGEERAHPYPKTAPSCVVLAPPVVFPPRRFMPIVRSFRIICLETDHYEQVLVPHVQNATEEDSLS